MGDAGIAFPFSDIDGMVYLNVLFNFTAANVFKIGKTIHDFKHLITVFSLSNILLLL